MNDQLSSLANENDNVLIVLNDDANTDISFDETISSASLKLISQDSMNMVYEALSSKGTTYVFDMDSISKDNKIVNQINRLISNREIGSIEYLNMADGLTKMQLKPQKEFNDVYAEVEKLAYKLLQKLNK
jgi:mitochondrial fission protein ELM1